MAISLEDGIVVPVGWLQRDTAGNRHRLSLTALPVVTDPRRTATRSPARALWFCFLKVVLKRNKEVFQLRYIEYVSHKVKYHTDGLDGKVAAAHRILLLVHGIIGNTESMAAHLEDAWQHGHYDLVLTFDYENLNTTIENITVELKDRLEAAGISKDHPLDIIAHSMGGLHPRRASLSNNPTAEQLCWCGSCFFLRTPNAGSALASHRQLPGMGDWPAHLRLQCGQDILMEIVALLRSRG